MLPTYLLLLAGGLMLAEAVRDPRRRAGPAVWYCHGGAVAVVCCAAAVLLYLVLDRPAQDVTRVFRRVQSGLLAVTFFGMLMHVRADRAGKLRLMRAVAAAAYAAAVLAAANLLHEEMIPYGTAAAVPPKWLSVLLQTLACAGAAAVVGLSVNGVVSCVAPASGEPAAAGRYDGVLAAAVSLRAAVGFGVVVAVLIGGGHRAALTPGVLAAAGARWGVGLAAPAVLLAVAARGRRVGRPGHFRAVEVAIAVLVLVGEVIAVLLVRGTGLPF